MLSSACRSSSTRARVFTSNMVRLIISLLTPKSSISAAMRRVWAVVLEYLKQPVSVAMPVYRHSAIPRSGSTPSAAITSRTTMAAAA